MDVPSSSMDVARALSFDVPSNSMVPHEESLLPARDVDEEIQFTEQFVDPYFEIEQVEKPLQQCPFVGMELDSVEAAYKFYNSYGFNIGFSIRKAQQYHSAIGEKKLISQRFVCSNEGLSKRQKEEMVRVGITPNKEKTPQKAISFRRTNCKASMNYRDPPQSQCKGKRKPERFKHPIEKKLRTCTNCGMKAGHNSRTCPQGSYKKDCN